jgi:imidazole glycerol phosphate synthase subunit HisF
MNSNDIRAHKFDIPVKSDAVGRNCVVIPVDAKQDEKKRITRSDDAVQDVRSNYVTFSRHHSRQGLKGTAEVSIS